MLKYTLINMIDLFFQSVTKAYPGKENPSSLSSLMALASISLPYLCGRASELVMSTAIGRTRIFIVSEYAFVTD